MPLETLLEKLGLTGGLLFIFWWYLKRTTEAFAKHQNECAKAIEKYAQALDKYTEAHLKLAETVNKAISEASNEHKQIINIIKTQK
jgi:hypothetical protein